jgi:hypothetical protein
MDEEELDEYQKLIDLIEDRRIIREIAESELLEQMRDEEYMRVPGCYRVLPAPVE